MYETGGTTGMMMFGMMVFRVCLLDLKRLSRTDRDMRTAVVMYVHGVGLLNQRRRRESQSGLRFEMGGRSAELELP
jgi:hypothetical protein